jgi:hypothetical protein
MIRHHPVFDNACFHRSRYNLLQTAVLGTLCVYLFYFVSGLFNDTANSSEYTAQNYRLINK